MSRAVLEKCLENIVAFLEPHLALANSHTVEFFTENHFSNFISPLLGGRLTVQEAIASVFSSEEQMDFVAESRRIVAENLDDRTFSCSDASDFLVRLGCCCGPSGPRIKEFMSEKKLHEVHAMGDLALGICEMSGAKHVVDVGDGKGYLSSALALADNELGVLGVDASATNTTGAAKRAGKMQRYVRKSDMPYKQTTEFVTPATDVVELLRRYFDDYDGGGVCLVGLHTCGPLAPTCLRMFDSNPAIRSVANVGCCYHHLDDSSFPLSRYLTERRFRLERNSRMLACQSIDRIIAGREMPIESLFYRSVLQVAFRRLSPQLLGQQIGRKLKACTNFEEYVAKAYSKLGSAAPPAEQTSAILESLSPKRDELDLFYLLRAHLAPAIEAVILLDRLLFLRECGWNDSYLVRLFDPVVSPRCYAIVAMKDSVE